MTKTDESDENKKHEAADLDELFQKAHLAHIAYVDANEAVTKSLAALSAAQAALRDGATRTRQLNATLECLARDFLGAGGEHHAACVRLTAARDLYVVTGLAWWRAVWDHADADDFTLCVAKQVEDSKTVVAAVETAMYG